MEKNEIFSYSWHIDEQETERTVIRIYGLDSNNDSVCLIVNNFQPYVYLELPLTVNWDDAKASLVSTKLNTLLQERKAITYQFVLKKRLYYANLDRNLKRRVYPYLRCCFSHTEDIRQLSFKIRSPLHVPGIGPCLLKIHEHNASPILQLTSQAKIPTAGWVKFAGKRVASENQLTYCKHEFVVRYENLAAGNNTNVARPLLMGYDIEVYSSIPSSMPKAHRPPDKVFQISCVFSRQGGKPEDYDRYSPMVSRLLHLVIIDILTTGVALRYGANDFGSVMMEENVVSSAGTSPKGLSGWRSAAMISRSATCGPSRRPP